ncbi:MAG: zinc ribbon domain-containing protein [Acidobacteria bacterium]|nr:zinc ribbon domain-containing protein [Acidobacteriota bacterium]
MAATVEKALGECGNCGMAVRENTFFCYNCGHKVGELSENGSVSVDEDEARTAIAEIAEKIHEDEKEVRGLESAAKERKRSRATKRKKTEVVWSPAASPTNLFVVLVSLLIAALVFSVIFVMVLWK